MILNKYPGKKIAPTETRLKRLIAFKRVSAHPKRTTFKRVSNAFKTRVYFQGK
jgi:hypothetical protein